MVGTNIDFFAGKNYSVLTMSDGKMPLGNMETPSREEEFYETGTSEKVAAKGFPGTKSSAVLRCRIDWAANG